MEEFYNSVILGIDINDKDVDMYAPLVLAYIGDTVYEVFIRTMLLKEKVRSVHALHKRATNFVKASGQAEIVHKLMNLLTEEEQNIIRRGRNAKSGTVPKNADITQYKIATGFEALIGYLYLKKRNKRLIEILNIAYNIKR